MRIIHLIQLTCVAIVAVPTIAFACIMSFRPAEELKSEASVVVLASVLSKEISGQSDMGETYTYQIKVETVERGTMLSGITTVKYFNLRAHERDGMMECFYKDGAGLETDLKTNQRYRFFLKSADDRDILYSELV